MKSNSSVSEEKAETVLAFYSFKIKSLLFPTRPTGCNCVFKRKVYLPVRILTRGGAPRGGGGRPRPRKRGGGRELIKLGGARRGSRTGVLAGNPGRARRLGRGGGRGEHRGYQGKRGKRSGLRAGASSPFRNNYPFNHSKWKEPGLSTRSKVCAPK
jgi:hypothetical protein